MLKISLEPLWCDSAFSSNFFDRLFFTLLFDFGFASPSLLCLVAGPVERAVPILVLSSAEEVAAIDCGSKAIQLADAHYRIRVRSLVPLLIDATNGSALGKLSAADLVEYCFEPDESRFLNARVWRGRKDCLCCGPSLSHVGLATE